MVLKTAEKPGAEFVCLGLRDSHLESVGFRFDLEIPRPAGDSSS
jgi:hypothetical protein